MVQLYQDMNLDVLALQEHRIDTTKVDVIARCKQLVAQLPKPSLTLASSPVPSSSHSKPGGTAILSSGPIASRRAPNQIPDWLGRWTTQTFTGKLGKSYVVYSAYQVAQRRAPVGRNTASNQQEACLRQQGINSPNPRRQFYKDLKKALADDIKNDREVLLLGDFNECLYQSDCGLVSMVTEFELYDLMYEATNNIEFPTYARGQKRIDFILGTRKFKEALIQGGYLPFGEAPSDHRMYYLDFDTTKLFRDNKKEQLNKIPKISYRDKSTVISFLDKLDSLIDSRNLLQRSNRLLQDDKPNHKLAEQLDLDMKLFCLKAQATVTKNFRETQWSLELMKLKAKVMICQLVMTRESTRINLNNQIQKYRSKYDINDIPETWSEAKALLSQLKSELSSLQKEHEIRRKMEQEAKIISLEASSELKDVDKAKIIRRIKKAEFIKKIFRKIGRIRKLRSSTITKLRIPRHPDSNPKTIPDVDDNWTDITETTDMLNALVARNKKHFGQAEYEQTPFFHEPLRTTIDFTASTISADTVLSGDFDCSNLDQATASFIQGLQAKYQHRIQQYLTIGDMKEKLKKWDEATTTSPVSGLHLGIWKSIFCDHMHSKPCDDKKPEYDRKQSKMQQIWCNLINYALKYNYTYSRWKQIVTQMILKKAGDYRIHRLRVIHLYEADYNLILGIFWRKALHQAEDQNLINESLYGGRPAKNAHMPVFVETMENEISRMSRKHLIKFDNDATSCYDRILVSVGAIASRAFGMPRNVTMVWAKTLEEARYKLKMNAEISEEYYQHSKVWPIHGSGQGSGNSPCVWLFISSVLVDCYSNRARGATFESPDKSLTQQVYLIGFVDDTTGKHNRFCLNVQPTKEELVTGMGEDAQLWHDLLWSSGGALELPKCFYQLLYWDFNKGRPYLQCTADTNVSVKTATQQEVQIKHLSPYSTRKLLGHAIGPSPSLKRRKLHLTDNLNRHRQYMIQQYLTREEAWTYYHSIYLPSITFSLPNSSFDETTLYRLEKIVRPILLSRCGFNRTTARAIVYGPWELGGCMFKSLYAEQVVGNLQQILQYLRGPPTVHKKLLQIAIHWAQYTSGVSKPIFEYPDIDLPHLESIFFSQLRKSLTDIQGSLRLHDTGIPPIQRVNDQYIMDVVLSSKKFTEKQIVYIDLCRKYLQVLTVSDLATPCGKRFDQQKVLGKPTAWSSITKMHHINQVRPPNEMWRQWYRACRLLGSLQVDGTLYKPLGSWTQPLHKLRTQWPLYYDPVTKVAYQREQSEIPDNHVAGVDRIVTVSTIDDIPPSATPATLHEGHLNIGDTEPPYTPELRTWEDYFSTLPTLEQDLLRKFQYWNTTQVQTLWTKLRESGDLLIASDGSVRHQSGTFGIVIATPSGERLFYLGGEVQGWQPSSYRAELFGALVIVTLCFHVRSFLKDSTPLPSKVFIDNKSVVDLNKALQNKQTIDQLIEETHASIDYDYYKLKLSTLAPDWDLIAKLQPLLRESVFQDWTFDWIASHQDKDREYIRLSLPAQLNCDADHVAEEAHDTSSSTPWLIPTSTECPVHLDLQGRTLTSKYKHHIRKALAKPPLLNYIQRRYDWDSAILHSIDWPLHGNALRKKIQSRTTYCKLVHDLLPTNQLIHRYQPDTSPSCPRCHNAPEDRDHVIRCSHADPWFAATLRKLRVAMEQTHTDPVLLHIFLTGLTRWRDNEVLSATEYPSEYHALITQQEQIGWRQVWNGRWTSLWGRLQASYAQTMAIPGSQSSQWALALLLSVWEAWDDLWCERNSVVHGDSPESRRALFQDRVLRDLRRIYSQQHLYLPRDRQYLLSSYEVHSTHDIHSIANWIHAYDPVFQSSIEAAKSNSLTNVASITNYVPLPPQHLATTRKHHPPRQQLLSKPFRDNRTFTIQRIRTFFSSRRTGHRNPSLRGRYAPNNTTSPGQNSAADLNSSNTSETTFTQRFLTQNHITQYFQSIFPSKKT